MNAAPTRHVLMLAFENCQILDVTGPLEILAAANELNPETPPAYRIELAAGEAGMLRTTSGLSLIAERSFHTISDAELEGVHTFMVAGGDGTWGALRDKELIAFVRRAGARATRVASVCSGAAILAQAGLLDGRRATTHWNAAAAMARAFPKVQVEADAIFVRDGAIWTSAGITAGMDLAIALIEQDLGREAALSVARRHVLYMVRPGGQSQFSAAFRSQAAEQTRAARALAHINAHLASDLRLPALAAATGMSARSLQRIFRDELDAAPAEIVLRARLEAARSRLSEGAGSIERIAAGCGFVSPATLRRAFHKAYGVSPADYRARFGPRRERRAPAQKGVSP